MKDNTNIISNVFSRLSAYGKTSAVITGIRDLFSEIRSDLQSIRIMRFAVGVTLAVAIASAVEWPLAFLVPILTSVFLAMPLPMIPLKVGLANMLYTVAAFSIGLVFTLLLLPFPLAYMPMLALVLFNLYYMLNRGGSFWFVLMSLLAVLILPLLGNTDEGLAKGFAFGFVFSGWITIFMLWLAHLLVPDPVGSPQLPKKPGLQPGYSLPAAQAALKSTVVVLPIVIFFITFEFTGQLLVLVFAAIFTLSPEVSKGKAAGVSSMKSTVIGGLYAFVFYALIVAVPEYHFFVVLMFLTTLFFASNIFSDKPAAKYYASAFSTLYILVNSSLAEDADFTSAFLLRFLFILLATVYVVFSLMVFERYWPQRSKVS